MTEPAPAPLDRTHRGLGARAVRRRAPRRPGVRRRRRRRPLDQPGQEGRLLHGDQRRGRHRRDAPGRVPRGPRGRAGRVRADRRRRRGRLPRPPRRHPGVRRAAAPRDRRGGPAAPARTSCITNNFRDTWGGREPQPGRPHRHRQGHARRRARRRQPLGLPRPARRRARAVGRRPARSGAPAPRTRRTAVDITDTFDEGVASLRAHQAYIDGLGLGGLRPGRVPRGHVAGRPASGSGVAHAVAFEVFPMGWGSTESRA